jgi:short-subunit dehydrogenase
LEEVARAVAAVGGQAVVLPTDVRDEAQTQHVVRRALETWGRVDIIVANAGAYVRSEATALTMTHLQEAIETNYYGAARLVLAALPAMLANRGGHIVLISSLDARTPLPTDGPYVAAKAALAGLGEVLRQELKVYGIAVTTVYPGRIDTDMIADIRVPRVSAKMPPERVARAVVRAIRVRRRQVILPYSAWLLIAIRALAPSLADWLTARLGLAGVTSSG